MKKNMVLETLVKELFGDTVPREFTRGQAKVVRAYYESKRKGYPMLVIDEICWETEREDIIAAIREAGIRDFIFADASSASMETLFDFVTAGFKVVEPIKYNIANPTRWDSDRIGLVIRAK